MLDNGKKASPGNIPVPKHVLIASAADLRKHWNDYYYRKTETICENTVLQHKIHWPKKARIVKKNQGKNLGTLSLLRLRCPTCLRLPSAGCWIWPWGGLWPKAAWRAPHPSADRWAAPCPAAARGLAGGPPADPGSCASAPSPSWRGGAVQRVQCPGCTCHYCCQPWKKSIFHTF